MRRQFTGGGVQVSFHSSAGAAELASPALSCGQARGLRRPGADGFAAIHALVAELIGGEVARAETLAAVDAIHPGSVMVNLEDDASTGMLAVLPLRQAGCAALLAGSLDGVDPDLELVTRPLERPAAVYAWGCAATTRSAARAVMATAAALPDEAFDGTPFFARAATAAGLRALIDRLGYAPIGRYGLLRRLPTLRRAA